MTYYHGTDARTATRIKHEGLLPGSYVAEQRNVAARYAHLVAAAAECDAAVIEVQCESVAHDPRHAAVAPNEPAYRTQVKVPPQSIGRVQTFPRSGLDPERARQHRVLDKAAGVPAHARPR
jgi:RNA:NAD 2'-phosphotransferase (TPT1/KptA family)